MAELPGFVDAIPGSVKQENGIYTAEVLMHINSEAFSMRFDPEHIAAAEAEKAAAGRARRTPSRSRWSRPVADAEASTDGAADGSDDRRRGELTCSSTASSASRPSWSCSSSP